MTSSALLWFGEFLGWLGDESRPSYEDLEGGGVVVCPVDVLLWRSYVSGYKIQINTTNYSHVGSHGRLLLARAFLCRSLQNANITRNGSQIPVKNTSWTSSWTSSHGHRRGHRMAVRSTSLFMLENRNWTRLVQKPNWTETQGQK